MYKCIDCKKIVGKLDEKIRCPYCGARVFVKLRPKIVKRVRAR